MHFRLNPHYGRADDDVGGCGGGGGGWGGGGGGSGSVGAMRTVNVLETDLAHL